MATAHAALHDAQWHNYIGADFAHEIGPLLCSVSEANLVFVFEDLRDGVFLFGARAEKQVIGQHLTRVLRRRPLKLGDGLCNVGRLEQPVREDRDFMRQGRRRGVDLVSREVHTLRSMYPDATAVLAEKGAPVSLRGVTQTKRDERLAELELFWLEDGSDRRVLRTCPLLVRHSYSIRSSVRAAETASGPPES